MKFVILFFVILLVCISPMIWLQIEDYLSEKHDKTKQFLNNLKEKKKK